MWGLKCPHKNLGFHIKFTEKESVFLRQGNGCKAIYMCGQFPEPTHLSVFIAN